MIAFIPRHRTFNTSAPRRCSSEELSINLFETTYFLRPETGIPTTQPGMMLRREGHFAFMACSPAGFAVKKELGRILVKRGGAAVAVRTRRWPALGAGRSLERMDRPR
jgi:hypothetical protein